MQDVSSSLLFWKIRGYISSGTTYLIGGHLYLYPCTSRSDWIRGRRYTTRRRESSVNSSFQTYRYLDPVWRTSYHCDMPNCRLYRRKGNFKKIRINLPQFAFIIGIFRETNCFNFYFSNIFSLTSVHVDKCSKERKRS